MVGSMLSDLELIFEDVKFLRATYIQKNVDVEFVVMIQSGTGRFEISEGSSAVVTGYINKVDDIKLSEVEMTEDVESLSTLLTKDFYKELRLRGYHYHGAFKSVTEARCDGLSGKVKWDGNWVAFMDCLLQIYIIGRDTRNLLLPTGIERLVINPKLHISLSKELATENPAFDVVICPKTKKLRCGGIEIKNITASPVNRRRSTGVPILEIYNFIPNMSSCYLSMLNAARFCVQLLLENVPSNKVKAVEVDSCDDREPLVNHVATALSSLPLVTFECNYLSSKVLDLEKVFVEDKPLSFYSKCQFIIKSNCLNDKDFLESCSARLIPGGFIVSRENSVLKENLVLPASYQLIAKISVANEILFILQLVKSQTCDAPKTIQIKHSENEEYQWLDELKRLVKQGPVIAFAQNESHSGILGLVNCIRKEPGGSNLRCVFVHDSEAPSFDINDPFYSSQMKLGLAINVFKNGNWGTFRHFLMDEQTEFKPRAGHCYADSLIRGDLSSMTWLAGPYNFVRPKGELVAIKYASLNFRDVMMATGKLTAEVFGSGRLDQECILGCYKWIKLHRIF
jgi:fatty acid synthase